MLSILVAHTRSNFCDVVGSAIKECGFQPLLAYSAEEVRLRFHIFPNVVMVMYHRSIDTDSNKPFSAAKKWREAGIAVPIIRLHDHWEDAPDISEKGKFFAAAWPDTIDNLRVRVLMRRMIEDRKIHLK